MSRWGFILGVVALLAFAGAGWAGDYHYNATLICSDCHVMHYSQSHGYNANGSGNYLSMGDGGPFAFLLRDEVNQLCLDCHDGQVWAPDVFEANTGSAVRLAGGLNRTTSAGPYYPAGGHTLGSTDAPPGYVGTWDHPEGLECVDCHRPHGAATYRNMSASSGFPTVSYAIGTNDLTKDVFERSMLNYDVSQVDFNEPVATASKYGEWCQHCHTDFHGTSLDGNMRDQTEPAGEGWYRHPTADANIGALGGGHSSLATFNTKLYRVKVMSPTGDWGTQGSTWPTAPADLTASCFSCHKSHGSKNAFGLIYLTGTTAETEEGDGTNMRSTCKQCHRQGG